MNILFYIPHTDIVKEKQRLYRVVEMAGAKAKTEIFRNVPDLSRRLSKPAETATIAVVLISDRGDLNDFVSIRHLLSDIPFILILPHRDNRTTSIGFNLAPRFLTYADTDLREVGAVLEKMIKNYSDRVV
ncbi:MAG: hypothetical protein JW896_16095 [Deltaproteobacteria bacterium]|nr:hypothetical protein [Deltaproteobacteria bacterium]